MSTLTQCDRCKRIDKSRSDYKTLEISEDDNRWEICEGCTRDFNTFMKNMNVMPRNAVTAIERF